MGSLSWTHSTGKSTIDENPFVIFRSNVAALFFLSLRHDYIIFLIFSEFVIRTLSLSVSIYLIIGTCSLCLTLDEPQMGLFHYLWRVLHGPFLAEVLRKFVQDYCTDHNFDILVNLLTTTTFTIFRSSQSTVKQQLQNDAGYSALLLSEMDTIFMATYAAGNIINGKLGDTFDPTIILAIGLWGSGICLLFINVAIWFDFHGMSAMLGNVFILSVYFLFGFFQATGGPVGTAVMGNWFCDADSIRKRGTIFGFWTCHQYCGDITAQLCTAFVLKSGKPYWWALLLPAITNLAWGFLTARLIADPANVDIITPEVRIRKEKMEAKRKEMAEQGETMAADTGPAPITYLAALAIPMVAQYAFAFGFFKLVNYCLFFWLPYFLGKTFDPVAANLIAALYSVGMMPGGIIVGYVSDLFGGRRAVVIGVFMCTLIVFLAIFAKFSESGALGAGPMLFMLGCMGILVGG